MPSDSLPPNQAPIVDAQHPWLGLLPYKEEHRDYFFGRDSEIEDILGRIRDNSLTILYGQSGWGKSSLLAAGVVPRLREAGYAPKIIRLTFSARASLREQTLAALPSRPLFIISPEEHSWRPQHGSLWELFHRRRDSETKLPTPVIIFDQFEEIFTLGAQPQFETEVSDWLEQMADLLQNRPPKALAERLVQKPALAEQYHFGDAAVRIVFTLREDYLAHLERWKARLPLLMQNRMALTLLTGPQARQAVLGPAQMGDHSLVTREVAEMIVRRVADVPDETPLEQIKAVPPLLSLLCEQLNTARLQSGFGFSRTSQSEPTAPATTAPQITAEMVRDQATDILQRFYVDSFLAFPDDQRSRIRAWLEDTLLTQTEPAYRNSIITREASAQLTALGIPEPQPIFDTLLHRRLITAETRDQIQRLEVTHDVLVPLLAISRKQRQDREAKECAEQAAAEATKRERKLARERRKHQVMVVFICLGLISIALAVWALREQRLAALAEGKATAAASLAAAAERRAHDSIVEAARKAHGAARNAFDNKKDLRMNLAYLAEALRYNRSLPADRQQNSIDQDAFASVLRLPPPSPIPLGEPMRHEGAVISAAFSPDGQRIVTASDDNTARLWDAASGKPLGQPMLHEDTMISAAFSPDGQRVVTTSHDKTARLWEAASSQPLDEPMRHEFAVWSAAFSPDGQRVVTASSDNTARLWDAASGKPLGEPMRHEGRGGVWSAAFSPDGQRVVTASDDKTARLWDAASGKPLGQPMRHEFELRSAAFSPDGQRIVTVIKDNTARLWDAASGQPLGESMRHEGEVNSAAFSPDGQRIVTASDDNTARLWDAASGKPLGQPMRHEDTMISAAFSPDGQRIITASRDNTARLWDGASGKPMSEPLLHEDRVLSATFSPDGQRIVTASKDNNARLWDVASCKPLGGSLRHEATVISGVISPDGRRIATVSLGNTVQLWDVATSKPLGEPLRHEGTVISAVFTTNGQRIVTTNWDTKAQLWDAVSGKPLGLISEAEQRVALPLKNAEGVSINMRVAWAIPLLGEIGSPLGNDLIHWGGTQINDEGQSELVAHNERAAWRSQLLSLAPTSVTPWQTALRWALSDPRTRKINFTSQTTTPEHLEREITWAMAHLEATRKPPTNNFLDSPSSDRTVLTDAYPLDPGFPLIHLALAAVEENTVSREFLIHYGLKRLAAWEQTPATKTVPAWAPGPGHLLAKAAIILWLQGDRPRARQVFAELLDYHDPQKQTWGSKAWIEKLPDFEWPKVFRDTLLELAK